MLHSLFIVNKAGQVVIEKHWRGVTDRHVVDFFMSKANACMRAEDVPTVLVAPKHYLIHILRHGLYYVVPVTAECPPLLIVELLHKIADIFDRYFGNATESALKRNFSTAFQLLGETVDNGIPFVTESNALEAMIPPPTLANQVVAAVTGKSNIAQNVGSGILTNMPWRRGGVKYTSNEIYFDVIEEIHTTVTSSGKAITCEVLGRIDVNSRLSGTPDLVLSMGNASILDNGTFHPCIRMNVWEREHCLSFVPPDGKFTLCTYRIPTLNHINLPFYVTPSVVYKEHSGSVNITLGPKPGSNLCKDADLRGEPVAESIKVVIPFPTIVRSTDLRANHGKVVYDEKSRLCTWTVGRIPGEKSPTLTGRIDIVEAKPWKPGSDAEPARHIDTMPIMLEFKVPKTTVSGIRVGDLRLTNEKYKMFKGVKCKTINGDYQMRLPQ